MLKIENIDNRIMDHTFPGSLRYGETPDNVIQYIDVLIETVLDKRRLAKRILNQHFKEV